MRYLALACSAALLAADAFALVGRFEAKQIQLNGIRRDRVELESGKIYRVVGDVDCQAGIEVKAGGVAAICIPAGASLKSTGAKAVDRTAARAGIGVPQDATLVIFGDGKLEANGGAGANGSAGKGASAPIWQGTRMKEGIKASGGGNGGDGGGGGAAGIGGDGGNGGAGAAGGSAGGWYSTEKTKRHEAKANGANGGSPDLSESGKFAPLPGKKGGTLYVLGSVAVKAVRGAAGASGGMGGAHWRRNDQAPGIRGYAGYYMYHFYAGGGAGGGGGGSGWTAFYDIGCGGRGGSGGGGGGGGGLYYAGEWIVGKPGEGGRGAVRGANGVDISSEVSIMTRSNAEVTVSRGLWGAKPRGRAFYGYRENMSNPWRVGGNGGTVNVINNINGGSGRVFLSRDAKLTGTVQDNIKASSETQDNLFFVCSFFDDNSHVIDQRNRWYGARSTEPAARPEKDGFLFMGYFTGPNGTGQIEYDCGGTPLNVYRHTTDINLYPSFIRKSDFKPTGITVNNIDAAYLYGPGWTYTAADGVLTLMSLGEESWCREFDVRGSNTDGRVRQIVLKGSGTIRLWGLNLATPSTCALAGGKGLFEVASGVTNAVIEIAGSNTLAQASGNGSGLVCGGVVTVRAVEGNPGGTLALAGAGTGAGIAVTRRLTVEDGRLVALGGAADGSGLSGGANYRQTGGTVLLAGGGNADDLVGGPAKVVGGSLCLAHRARKVNPQDDTSRTLYCIRTAVPDSTGDDTPVVVSNAVGATGFGTKGIYPIDGRIYLWRPNSDYYEFVVDGATAYAAVKNADTNAYYVLTGVTVNGENVGMGLGDGWRWSPSSSNLTFRAGYTNQMTVSGIDRDGNVHPVVDFDTRLRFSNLSLFGWGVKDGVMDVTNGTLSLTLAGTNVLAGLRGFRGNGLAVYPNAALQIDGGGILSATGGVWGAGIGGVWGTGPDGLTSCAGTIDIQSGTVTAVGGFEGAGIGGASGVGGGTVNVAAGAQVTAWGGFGAAGVGAGAWSDRGGTLTGTVTAHGGAHASAIGAGMLDCGPTAPAPGTSGSGGLEVADLSEAALRGAVAAANAAGGGTITFDSRLSGTLELTQRLVVDAKGPVTVDGGGRIRLTGGGTASDGGGAILATGGALTLKGLSFQGFATTGCGGAVRAENGLTAVNCTFEGCRAGEYGGAAYVSRNAAATFTNCRFSGNAAGLSGGAVFARRSLTAVRCSFDGNDAPNGGAAVGAFVPDGRAVAEHCSFLGNTNARRGGGLDVGAGHAVAAACTFTRNGGGGIYAADWLSAASTLTTGNDTPLSCCPPDAEIGLHASEFLARACSFGRVAAGTFLDNTVVGLGPNEPFQTDGAVFTKTVDQVQQVYRKLTYRNKRIVQGCAVWHTPGWETALCSPSVNPSVSKAVLYGHSEAHDLCATDQLGTPRTDANLLVGAVTEASERESLVVTTANDVVDPEDELTSLREAIFHTASDDMPARMDRYREITVDRALFGADGALTLTATGGTFRIEGGRRAAISGGEDRCALRLAAAFDGDLFVIAPTNALSLEKLTVGGTAANAGELAACNVRFEGAPASRTSVVSSGDGRLAFERCTFFGNGAGCADISGQTLGHALGCTVVSNGAAGAAWLFRIGAGVTFDFANCTFADNRVSNAAIVTAASGGTCLVNCALTANGNNDLATTGEGTFLSAYTSYGKASAKLTDHAQTRSGLTAANAFDGPVRSTLRYGVRQAYYRQARGGSIRCTGAYAFHSDDWQALAFGVYRNGDQRVALRDRMDRANFVVVSDIVERPIVQRYVSRGSYATCCDEEYFEDGEILVNTPKDFPEHLVEHDYDGLVTLREAVDFSCSHLEFRDKDGNCTVRFADRFLDGRASNAVMLVRAQIDVPSGVFTNGTLRVVGRTDGGVIVDGGGDYRIWRTGASNQVGFENLTFRNGIGVAADWTHTCGGALYNLGCTRAVNCAFCDCFAGWPSVTSAGLAGRASGGAVYTGDGGNTVLERCTLKNCVAGYGGALFTAAGGATTALACTFTGNRAVEGVLVLEPYGGAVVGDGRARTSLVNCTITDNESAGTVGGVAGLGTPGDFSLYLLSSIVTGNRARDDGQDDADLSCAGSAKVCRSVYGRRGDTSNDTIWKDTDAVGGVAPSDVFAQVTEDGAAVGVDLQYDGVVQTVFPARPSDPATMKGAYARFVESNVWCEAAVWCDKITASPGGTEFWGSRIQWMKARSGKNFYHIDQLGREMSVATLGSTVLSGSSYAELVRPDGSVELFTSRDEAVDAANAAVTHEPWYTPIESGDSVRLVLNAQATPVIGAAVDFGAADASTVSVWLETDTVKPNLFYGLGWSETPVGPFVVEDGAWVRADADGVLREALTAPKIGPQGFYRVLVR